MAHNWARTVKQEEGSELFPAEHLPLDTLQQLFDDEITAAQAAEILRREGSALLDEGVAGLTFHHIVDAARKYPSEHAKLIALLIILGDPTLTFPVSEADRTDPWCLVPEFTRDIYYEWSGQDIPDQQGEARDVAIEQWININRFAASLTKTELPVFACYEEAFYTLRWCLEYPPVFRCEHTIAGWKKESDLESELVAATVWPIMLGDKLKGISTVDMHGNSGKGGPLWTGPPGYSIARMQFWKQRFLELAQFEGLPDEKQDLARRAANAMPCCEAEESDQ